jgi:hypothetical protein
MNAILCDICNLPIVGDAMEMAHVPGRLVQSEDGRQRIVQRGKGASLRYTCMACNQWIEGAIRHLQENVGRVPTAAAATAK